MSSSRSSTSIFGTSAAKTTRRDIRLALNPSARVWCYEDYC